MIKQYIDLQYQKDQVNAVIRKLGKVRKVLMQLPTGGGKTVEFAMLIDRYLKKNPDKSVLILVHRIELLRQAKSTISQMYPEYGIDDIIAGVKYVRKCHIYIGMVESVNTRAQFMELLNLGLVIIDECHIGNFIKMHNIFTKEYVVGVTATPLSQSKKTPMKLYYDDIVVGPQIGELIAIKRLSQNITRCPEDVVDETMLTVDPLTGDFDIHQMGMMFSRPKYVMNTFSYYRMFCKGQKTLIFNVNLQHSLDVCDRFEYGGVPCKHIDGETPDEERAETLKWFAETPDAVLCNVGIVGVGFDEPTIQSVIVNLATLSLPKWLQCCGRGGRYIRPNGFGEGGKEFFNIIDMGGNSVRFGDWSFDRDWERMFWNPPLPGKPGLAPVKTCPDCNGLVHAAVIQCKLPSIKRPDEICGHIFDRNKFEEAKFLGEMIIMTKNLNLEDLVKASHERSSKPYFAFYEICRQSVERLVNCLIEQKKWDFTDDDIEKVFQSSLIVIERWFRKEFPGKRFNKSWHEDAARKTFYQYFKTKVEEHKPKRRELVW